MARDLDETIGRGVARWVDGARRRRGWVVLGMLLGVVASLGYASRNLGIHGDTDSLFSQDLPFKQAAQRYYDAFPFLYETMFVVVDAETPERAGEAASALATRLQASPDFFHRAYLPGGGDFFETHAFLYLDTEELQDLADRLAEAQPYLAELSRDGSVAGLASIMARGARAVREGDVTGGQLSAMFDRFAQALVARMDGRAYQVSWAEVLTAGEIDPDARRRFLLVQPVLRFNELQPARASILEVRNAAAQLGLVPANGVRVRITGDVALSFEELEVVRDQAAAAGLASFVLVGLILTLGLRSSRMVLATLLTLLVGLVFTAGYTAVVIGHFNMISIAFAVLFIGLGVDFGIHFCMRYQDFLDDGKPHAAALTNASRDVGGPIMLCACTTAIGFFAFVPTDFVGVAELGAISGAGMFISLFCTLTLLPALLSFEPVPVARRAGRHTPEPGTGLAALPVRYPGAVRVTALVLGVGSVFLLPQARFDNNPLNVRDPSSESVRTFTELLERGSSSPWSVNAIAPDLPAAQRLAGALRELSVVGRVVTVADYVPDEQSEKLDIIGDVAIFLSPLSEDDGDETHRTFEMSVEALTDLETELARLLDANGATPLTRSARTLRDDLGRYLEWLGRTPRNGKAPQEAELDALERSVVGTLPEQLRTLQAALGAGRVTLENLPDALLERMVTEDGRVRLEVFPVGDLNDHAQLAAFVDGVREIEPDVAGSATEMLESGRAVVAALRQALLSAAVVMTLFLLVLWRRLNDTALVLIPLCLAAALTVAASVLADIPFNFADVIVLPLLLGIGVDSSIHMVHRARVTQSTGPGLLSTSTARAVAYSAATTIGSFGTMGFATHRGLATLGQLLTLGVAFTIVCNLIVLPSLIALRKPARN